MTPQQLRNSILQMAIEGKLTEQRMEDGNASDLLKEIKAEKAKLIAEKKIKKEKPLQEIGEDEIPFEIPDNWVWVRLGDILKQLTDGTHKTPKYTLDGIPFISVKDISSRKLNFDNTKFISVEENSELSKRCNPQKGDILLSKVGTTGIPVIIDSDLKFNIFVSIALLKFNSKKIIPEYLRIAIESPLVQEQCKKNTKGVGNKNWVIRDIANTIFLLPPLAEQKRIVARLEEILPQVDEYEKAYNELQELNKKFPDNLKNSLLQMAIEGKLVEQRAEDGNARDLLKEIQAEKAKLIAEKKIKKEKPLPEISEDETPFEIPDNWAWAYVGDLFMHNTGKAMNSSVKKINKTGSIRKFITTSNVYWNKFELTNLKEMFFSDDELERCTITTGDILICEGGAYYGRTAIWNKDYDICFQNHVHRLRKYKNLINMFFYYIFYFYRNNGLMQSKGTAMPGLSSVVLHNTVIPLPPLAEQKRIVAKLEQLLPLCDELGKECK